MRLLLLLSMAVHSVCSQSMMSCHSLFQQILFTAHPRQSARYTTPTAIYTRMWDTDICCISWFLSFQSVISFIPIISHFHSSSFLTKSLDLCLLNGCAMTTIITVIFWSFLVLTNFLILWFSRFFLLTSWSFSSYLLICLIRDSQQGMYVCHCEGMWDYVPSAREYVRWQ